MNSRKVLFIVSALLLFISNAFPQSKTDSLENKENTLDIHFVVGNENGMRIGLRYYFLKKYSAEFSYGIPLLTFGGLGYNIYEVGVNVYPFKLHGLICGIMGIFSYLPSKYGNDAFNSYTFSPYMGVLIPRDGRFMFHSRVGLNLVSKNFYNNNDKRFYLTFAFELGFAFDLF